MQYSSFFVFLSSSEDRIIDFREREERKERERERNINVRETSTGYLSYAL